ncbi:hypothetical protein FPCIR_2929 [Fusarium pseudocircinatum]|uniref:Uncharacterized protein n=1 Tax=Fusarium pseudocircinatum TaxID=56676 RepID=A0A8H5PKU6_9HYPO|nr:hypothetical protein FPCIR_2929 [Fusarium pseudocircinatum]
MFIPALLAAPPVPSSSLFATPLSIALVTLPPTPPVALIFLRISLLFIAAAGATAGATFIGLTTPTPRDTPVFRVDGVNVDWYENANPHRHGLNRTKYITYEKDGYLHKRFDTGVDILDPSGKRTLCRAYYDTRFWSNDLRNWEDRTTPDASVWADIGEDLFYQFVNREWKAGCVWFRGNKAASGGIYEASFELGASCSQEEPAYLNCGKANYNVEVAGFNF